MPAVIIAAPASGSGKTVTTLGLIAALRARGLVVRCAKTGPDFIDPQFHSAAAGSPCMTLDPWAMAPAEVRARAQAMASGADQTHITGDANVHSATPPADIVIIEGVMGLFDGAASGIGSTADLAALLGLPVILVVDAARQGQSVAALVHGFATYRSDVRVAGVIATRVASDRHARLIADAMSPPATAGVPDRVYLGGVRADPALALPSRHLGLVQAFEHGNLDQMIAVARQRVSQDLDLDALLRIAAMGQAPSVPSPIPVPMSAPSPAPASGTGFAPLAPLGQRIAVAQDEAFAFAYPHMLADWRAQGAEVMPFSPLAGQGPDDAADAVFLPGGYPELHAGRLAATLDDLTGWGAGVRAAAARRALVYGECGGYMALGKGLIDADGRHHAMLGLLPHATTFQAPRRLLGYRTLEHNGVLPGARQLRGHAFHYSSEVAGGSQGEQPPAHLPALFTATDALGTPCPPMGRVDGRVMGSYAHIICNAPEATCAAPG